MTNKYAIAGIAIAGVAVAAGVVIWAIGNAKGSSSCANQPCSSACPCAANETCVNGVCEPVIPPCGGGPQCTTDSDCSSCDYCVGGCCGNYAPVGLIQTNLSTYQQCVTASIPFFGPCFGISWSLCNKYPYNCGAATVSNGKTFTGYLQAVAGNGKPLKCIPVLLTNTDQENSMLVVNGQGTQSATLTTDSTGTVAFGFQMTNASAGAICPSAICETNTSGQYRMVVDAQIVGSANVLPFAWDINIKVIT